MTPSWPSVQWFIVTEDRVVGVTMINLPIIQAVTGHAGQIGPKMRDVPWWGLRTCTLMYSQSCTHFQYNKIHFKAFFFKISVLTPPSPSPQCQASLQEYWAHLTSLLIALPTSGTKLNLDTSLNAAQHTADSIKLGSKHNSSFFVCSASLNVAKTVGTWRNFVHLHVCAMKVLGTRNTSHSPSPFLWYSDF